MRIGAFVLAAALLMAPLGAKAADLVVWWEEGQYAEEDAAVREVIAAFEQESGKQVELVLGPQEELVADLVAALEAGRRTPDFVFTVAETQPYERWAYEGRLVDLTDAVGHFSDLFDPDALERVTLLDGTTGRRGLYLLPMGVRDPPRPRLEEPARARRLHARGHPERVGRLLGVLVRPGPAGRAQGAGPRRRLGHRPFHVGRLGRHARTGSGSSSTPTRPTT